MSADSVPVRGIEFEIKGTAEKAARGVDKLTKSLQGLKSSLGDIGLSEAIKGLKGLSESVGNLNASNVKNMASSIAKIGKQSDKLWEVSEYLNTISQLQFSNLAEAAQNISDIGRAAKSISKSEISSHSSDWKEKLFSDFGIEKTVAQDFGDLESIRRTEEVIEEFGDVARENGEKASRSIPKYSQVRDSIAEVGTAAKKTKSTFGDFVKRVATAPFHRAADSAKNFANKIGQVRAAFKRILFYRLIRTVIKEIGDAFKTGVNNLYQWSSAVGGEFSASMDRMATSMQYFKNSIGAAVAPLLNALAPALDFVIDKVVSFLNVINQLFAKLAGATYWTKANKVAKAYADNASDAGSAAKEALRYLAPFDELNVLPSDSGGTSGGEASGSDYVGMFETKELFNQGVADFANMIKEAWDTGDWESVGATIADKLNKMIDDIPWKTLGAGFGKGINAIIGVSYWTLEKTNFTKLGNNIAEFVNNALENINFDIAGRLPVRQFTAVIDTIIGFLGGLSWKSIGQSISDFIRGSLSEGVVWFQSKDFTEMGKSLGENLVELVTNIDWLDLADKIWTFAGDALKVSWRILIGFLDGVTDSIIDSLFGENTWSYVKNWFIAGWNSVIDSLLDKDWGIANVLKNQLNLENWKLDPIEIDATAKITQAKDNVPTSQRNLSGVLALVSAMDTNYLPIQGRTIKNAMARVTDTDTSYLNWTRRVIPDAWSQITNTVTDNLPWYLRGVPNSYSILTNTEDQIPAEKKSVKDLTAVMTDRKMTSGVIAPINNLRAVMTKRLLGVAVKQPISDLVAQLTEKNDSAIRGSSINTKALFNEYGTENGWAPWSYMEGWFNDSYFASTWKKPWAYMEGWFNDSYFASTWKKPWAYATAYFNYYDQYTSGAIYGYWANKPWAYADVAFNGVSNGAVITLRGALASGGVFANGKWKPIQQYASGTTRAAMGQLFLAREAGPELVGTLGGHTAVMNNDQIVASVSDGVATANEMVVSAIIAAANQIVRALESNGGSDGFDIEAISRGVSNYQRRQARAMGPA